MKWLGEWFGSKGDEPVSIFGSGLGQDNSAGLLGSAIGSSQLGLSDMSSIANQMMNQQAAYNNSLSSQIQGIGAYINQAPDPGHSHYVAPPMKPNTSWIVAITKVENGFALTVTDSATRKAATYIATDVEGVTQMIATGLVSLRVEE